MMNAQEIIHYIATAEKKTPVKITLRDTRDLQRMTAKPRSASVRQRSSASVTK